MGGGVVVAVIVSDLLMVAAVVFWHPIIEMTKTRLTITKGKLEYLLLINALHVRISTAYPWIA
jgi:hypothetical protein